MQLIKISQLNTITWYVEPFAHGWLLSFKWTKFCCCYFVELCAFLPFCCSFSNRPHKRHQHLLSVSQHSQEPIVSKSRLSKHAFNCGFFVRRMLMLTSMLLHFNKMNTKARKKTKTATHRRESERAEKRVSLNKLIMQNERMTIATKKHYKKNWRKKMSEEKMRLNSRIIFFLSEPDLVGFRAIRLLWYSLIAATLCSMWT